jgi:hypothetical protein
MVQLACKLPDLLLAFKLAHTNWFSGTLKHLHEVESSRLLTQRTLYALRNYAERPIGGVVLLG